MAEIDIPRAEIEAVFKDLKKRTKWTYMKIYPDGGVKLVDDFGIFKEFEHYEEFFTFVRKMDRGR